ncbi:MAG TPA: ABC transporter permease [Steroidobacteraceae bacterium]|nr:ABC transporter permease [Steroidobacteraceae bacterium]
MKWFSLPAIVVYLKEMRESLRDRRVLLNALLLGPLMGPVIFLIILRLAVAHEVEQAEKPLPLPVIGAELAPNLISALKQADIQVLPPIEDPEGAVRSQQRDVVLRISADYANDWRLGHPAQVEIIYDSSRREANSQVQRLRNVLNGYSQLQSAMRIIARGLSPTIMHPVVIAERDQATPQARGAMVFAMLPYFLVFTAFMGGMFLAIDATAGERERHSLEPLLINPVPTNSVLLGKLAAICSFSLVSVAISLAAFAIAGYYLPSDLLTIVVLNVGFALRALPLMLPLILLISIVQTLVTAFSKNFREAQTYLGLIQLVPMIPSLVLTILPFKPQLWAYAIPLLGQQLIFMRLLRAETISLVQSGLCTVTTLACVVGLYYFAKRIYASERLAISA